MMSASDTHPLLIELWSNIDGTTVERNCPNIYYAR